MVAIRSVKPLCVGKEYLGTAVVSSGTDAGTKVYAGFTTLLTEPSFARRFSNPEDACQAVQTLAAVKSFKEIMKAA